MIKGTMWTVRGSDRTEVNPRKDKWCQAAMSQGVPKIRVAGWLSIQSKTMTGTERQRGTNNRWTKSDRKGEGSWLKTQGRADRETPARSRKV